MVSEVKLTDRAAGLRKARPVRARRSEPSVASGNLRASPAAVEKRRAARSFNELILSGGRAKERLDGRTEKRRQRMLDELREGVGRASKRPLKPIDVLLRAQALLELGESVSSLKKVCRAARPVPITEELVEGVRRLHEAYGFRVELYALVGISPETVERAVSRGPSVATTSARARRTAA
jgi:hypothetical protein